MNNLDLSLLGYSELTDLIKVLTAYRDDLFTQTAKENFDFTEVSAALDSEYNIYLKNSENMFQELVLNDGLLDLVIYTPYDSHSGTLNVLLKTIDDNWHPEDIECIFGHCSESQKEDLFKIAIGWNLDNYELIFQNYKDDFENIFSSLENGENLAALLCSGDNENTNLAIQIYKGLAV